MQNSNTAINSSDFMQTAEHVQGIKKKKKEEKPVVAQLNNLIVSDDE